jgi:hypothetical protein
VLRGDALAPLVQILVHEETVQAGQIQGALPAQPDEAAVLVHRSDGQDEHAVPALVVVPLDLEIEGQGDVIVQIRVRLHDLHGDGGSAGRDLPLVDIHAYPLTAPEDRPWMIFS